MLQLAVRQTQSRGLMMETRRWTGHLVSDIAGAPHRCPVVELMVRLTGEHLPSMFKDLGCIPGIISPHISSSSSSSSSLPRTHLLTMVITIY